MGIKVNKFYKKYNLQKKSSINVKVWTYYYQISNKIHYEVLQILVIWVLKLISFYKKNYDLQKKIVYKFGSLNWLLPNFRQNTLRGSPDRS